ncbi:hypothetical protein H0H92_006637, partial [Tricholoma furcatifolium]
MDVILPPDHAFSAHQVDENQTEHKPSSEERDYVLVGSFGSPGPYPFQLHNLHDGQEILFLNTSPLDWPSSHKSDTEDTLGIDVSVRTKYQDCSLELSIHAQADLELLGTVALPKGFRDDRKLLSERPEDCCKQHDSEHCSADLEDLAFYADCCIAAADVILRIVDYLADEDLREKRDNLVLDLRLADLRSKLISQKDSPDVNKSEYYENAKAYLLSSAKALASVPIQ